MWFVLPVPIESRAIAASLARHFRRVIALCLPDVLVGFTHAAHLTLFARLVEAIGARAIGSWFVHLVVVPFHRLIASFSWCDAKRVRDALYSGDAHGQLVDFLPLRFRSHRACDGDVAVLEGEADRAISQCGILLDGNINFPPDPLIGFTFMRRQFGTRGSCRTMHLRRLLAGYRRRLLGRRLFTA